MASNFDGMVQTSVENEKYAHPVGTSTPPMKVEDVENLGSSSIVDAETEKRLLKKLDIRIIPMICWIYLMNFMDRG